ncbi:hypothetical protein XH80_25650 [Bradyrhizobium sp. CCBAU 45384]|nr:hypothetical protein [Bradyrhizobium sp. CCBAU 45384]
MQRYYFPIIHNGHLQTDDAGEVFGSPDLAREYGARVARDIGSDPEFDRCAGTVVLVLDSAGTEIGRHVVASVCDRRAEETP